MTPEECKAAAIEIAKEFIERYNKNKPAPNSYLSQWTIDEEKKKVLISTLDLMIPIAIAKMPKVPQNGTGV